MISVLIPLLTGIVTFYTSKSATKSAIKEERRGRGLQKELRLSEFRQNWIDALRNDMSVLISYSMYPRKISEDERRNYSELMAKVLLRMNPKDQNFDALRKAMVDCYNVAEAGSATGKEAYRLTDVSQEILKSEWERLKSDLSGSDEV